MESINFLNARKRIAPHLPQPTPLVFSYYLSRELGRNVWLKLESQQPTGSFKVRPAFNSVLTRLEDARQKGVLASSSGNFAQAVAYAARELSLDAMIVMTSSTSRYKIQQTEALGAKVVICGDSFDERWETTYRIERETGRVLLHPYDSEDTIAGDGTLGLELMEQLVGDFNVVVPVSGGGLLAGVATAIKNQRPGCMIFGAQPAVNASMVKSLEAGHPIQVPPFKTIADALVAARPGDRTFEYIRKHAKSVVGVQEDEIIAASQLMRDRQKLMVEPGGAVGVAALIAGKIDLSAGDVVCVISGGNLAP